MIEGNSTPAKLLCLFNNVFHIQVPIFIRSVNVLVAECSYHLARDSESWKVQKPRDWAVGYDRDETKERNWEHRRWMNLMLWEEEIKSSSWQEWFLGEVWMFLEYYTLFVSTSVFSVELEWGVQIARKQTVWTNYTPLASSKSL